MRCRFHLVVLFAIAGMTGRLAGAQQRSADAVLRGVVIDSLGRRLAGARVSLLTTTYESVADSDGAFVLRAIPLGNYALLAQRLGYDAQMLTVNVSEATTYDLLVALTPTSAVVLDTVKTTAAATPQRTGLADFERHRTFGVGQFLTRRDIENRPGSSASSLLRSKAIGVDYIKYCSGRGYALATIGAGSITGGPVGARPCVMPAACYMQIFLDGLRLYSYNEHVAPPNIDDFKPDQLEAIEIYRGTETPPEYNGTGASCGTVLLWNRR